MDGTYFLTLLYDIVMITSFLEEKNVENLGSEGKLNRKSIIFTTRIDDIIKTKYIDDVGVDNIKSGVVSLKLKKMRNKHNKTIK